MCNQIHPFRLFQADTYFCHVTFDCEQSFCDGTYNVFTFDCEVKTRMVSDFLPMDDSFQLEPEEVLLQSETDLAEARELVLRVLKHFEFQANETVNSVHNAFALLVWFHTVACCDFPAVLDCVGNISGLC